MRAYLSVVALLACSSAPTFAADHSNLDTGFPVTIEDAYTVGEGEIEAQIYSRFIDLHDDPSGSSLYRIVPEVEVGLARNLQLTVSVPYSLGDGEEADSGEVEVEGLYNFNTEGLYVPAVAVAAGFNKPWGEHGEDGGLETELTFLATKSIGMPSAGGESAYAYVPRQIHFNASWFHNVDPLPSEREDRYLVGLGYSQPVTNDFVLVADVFRETDRKEDRVNNMAEIGTRFIMTPQTVLSAGVGVGFGGNRTEDLRVTIGLQHALSFPYLGPRP